jgi:hypothetical protein
MTKQNWKPFGEADYQERRLWQFIRNRCLDGFNHPDSNPYCCFPPLPAQIRSECVEMFGAELGREPALSIN